MISRKGGASVHPEMLAAPGSKGPAVRPGEKGALAPEATHFEVPNYGSNPNTATLFGVPTYTFPFAIIGVINLLSAK
jgi:hypothetical protein